MTPQDKSRERDRAILAALGWTTEPRSLYDEEGVEGWAWIDPQGDQKFVDVGAWDEPAPYPDCFPRHEEWEHAGPLLETLLREGWDVKSLCNRESTWYLWIETGCGETYGQRRGEGRTLPEAICNAFLAARKAEKE